MIFILKRLKCKDIFVRISAKIINYLANLKVILADPINCKEEIL
ncbi:hypothetical protein GJA_417 [Janthinobacterium agaricidamnosum NBRC 102515 = DSM 9628]|uniref:Uncharacterized protein n=1 Tax=Janthinobacterium agaricidamnosum NBRC 102515 = DSM 9628 TaxID=1349767 RepID=W0V169_9BURK|nr:hypothetical protein GJA_417 [Janthinobacterium agaricidamnosum NBRC 102515 = DSM 9628]